MTQGPGKPRRDSGFLEHTVGHARSPSRSMLHQPQMKTFLSYSRRHSHFARRIAEVLLANGLAVWFDEYELLKFRARSSQLMDDISAGLAGSDSGILISNLDYLVSAPCMNLEARNLLSRKPQIPILHISEPATPKAGVALSAVASHPGIEARACDSF